MSFHLAAYQAVTDDGPPAVTQYSLTPVTDMYLPSTATGFLLPSAMSIVAAYATSPVATVAGGGLGRVLIRAPSLLRTTYPYIRPISRNHPELTDPNVMNLVSHPLVLPASENVGVDATLTDDPTSEQGIISLLWFCDQLVPAPSGEAYTLRFSATAPSTTAMAWSAVGTMTFDQSLPAGAYTVIGFEHWSPHAVAARLVFPGMHMRPGVLSMGGATPFQADKRTDRLFYEGGLGVYGSFNSFAPPSLEVLTSTSDTAHEAYVTVVRTGDVGSLTPSGGAMMGASSSGLLR